MSGPPPRRSPKQPQGPLWWTPAMGRLTPEEQPNPTGSGTLRAETWLINGRRYPEKTGTAAPPSRPDEGALRDPASKCFDVGQGRDSRSPPQIDNAFPQDSAEPSGKVLTKRTIRRWTAYEGQPSPGLRRRRCREPASAGYSARWRRRGLPVRPRCLAGPVFGVSGHQSIGRGQPRKGTHTFPAAGGRRRSMKKAPRPSRNTRVGSYGKASSGRRPAPLH